MRRRREIPLFSISFLDLLSGALGAVIILYVAIPKNLNKESQNSQTALVESLKKELVISKNELKSAKEEVERHKDHAVKIPHSPRPVVPSEDQGANLDVGFKFKGKNIVFIIDTSQSMTEEDRMGQVKAGLKMLLTALSNIYKIEVVQFPYGQRAPLKTLWGTTRESDGGNKYDAFEFIYSMRPQGGTPTRDALLFVLQNYPDISDIVLLTDGSPSLHNSNKKDDIFDILRVVREENKKRVQINTIGVGGDFIKDKTSDRFKFLSSLSEQNNGFFVGF